MRRNQDIQVLELGKALAKRVAALPRNMICTRKEGERRLTAGATCQGRFGKEGYA